MRPLPDPAQPSSRLGPALARVFPPLVVNEAPPLVVNVAPPIKVGTHALDALIDRSFAEYGRRAMGPRWEALEVDAISWPFPTWRVVERPFDWRRDVADPPPPAVRRLIRGASPAFLRTAAAFYATTGIDLRQS